MSYIDLQGYMQERNAKEKTEKKRKLAELLDKYGESREAIDKNADVNDSFEYMLANQNGLIDEVLNERRRAREVKISSKSQSTLQLLKRKAKDITTIATDTLQYTPEALGELAADVQIAKQYYDKMNTTGRKLVNMYGKGQGADIDNYYHQLLQCELAKISPTSRDYGLRLGYAKEIWDYHKKKGKIPLTEISIDSRKDLKNNLYGSNLGYNNPDKNCEELLDDRRTKNMRKANIR